MRVYKIASVLAIFVIGVLFAGVAAVPTGAQYGTIQFHYNAQHTGDYSPVAGSNALSGKLTWSFTTGAAVLSSPAVANGTVYVGSDDNNLYALNATTGAKVWGYTTGNEVYSSPAVANGTVYVGSDDNNLYALNTTTGKLTWSFTTGAAVLSSPAVANGTVYVGSEDNNLYALKATNGPKDRK
jgi:outer membrane protein assembly factor BamB